MISALAWLYSAAVGLRRNLYDRGWIKTRRLPVPVISVGNLSAGGSGKSPVTAWIARRLKDRGHEPAVVSRGYRGRHPGPATVVSAGDGPLVEARVGGDEPVMLARQLSGIPIIVSRNRLDGATMAVTRFGARCVILDDAFQHRLLGRDLDLLLFDGADPIGNGRLLPAGCLREPIAAMARADAIVITRADRAPAERIATLEALAREHCPRAPIYHVRSHASAIVGPDGEPIGAASSLRGQRVVCFAGIARPTVFFEDVASLGARVVRTFSFPDHHRFSPAERSVILDAAAAAGAERTLTTEKDLARLGGAFSPAVCALRLATTVDREAEFTDMLERTLS